MDGGATAVYAMGAGLGHLSRTLKVINALGISSPVLIINNSRFLNSNSSQKKAGTAFSNPAVVGKADPSSSQTGNDLGDYQWITSPRACDFLTWFRSFVEEHEVQHFIVDCFPVGLKGELNDLSNEFPDLKLTLVARALRWESYEPLITAGNIFHRAFYIEHLPAQQLDYLKAHSHKLELLQLPSKFSCPPAIERCAKQLLNIEAWGLSPEVSLPCAYCAVIHSGSPEEVHILIAYAKQRLDLQGRDLPIVLISPDKLITHEAFHDVVQVQSYPALPLLLQAELVVSAAGFNILHELESEPVEHWVVPFDRRFDDQFLRASRYWKK